jgi:hypothetical protein
VDIGVLCCLRVPIQGFLCVNHDLEIPDLYP